MNAKHENIVLTMVAATVASIVMSLSLSWTTPVFDGIAGLSVFSLILSVGLKSAGVETVAGITVTNMAFIWLWMAFVVWFGLASGYLVVWVLSAVLMLAFASGAFERAQPK